MRLSISKSKNATLFYIIESTYINKKHSTRIIEKLGTLEEVKTKAGNEDPISWAKNYAQKLTKQDKDNKRKIIKYYSQSKLLNKNEQQLFNGGYLFLQDIYYDLKINNICKDITDKYQFKYDLNDILSKLIYSRIIYPSSKLKTLELSKNFIEQPNFEYQHILRGLEVIAKESDFKTKYFKDQNFYYKVIFNGNNVVTEYLMSLDTFEDMYSTRYNKYFILSTESFKEQDEFIKNNDGILESFSYFFNKAIKFIIGEIQGSIIYIMTTKTSYGIDLLKILYTMDDKTYNLLIRRNGYE